MKVHARDFFSTEEKGKLRKAVEKAEATTTGEIAVALIDQSDSYREAELLGSVLLAGLIAIILSVALNHTSIWFYIPVMVILFFPCLYLFSYFPQLKLALLTPARIHNAVFEEAVYTFYQKGVHKTTEQTGILIFISLLERKVWILADRGINEKIGADYWKPLAQELVAGIKEKRPLEALSSVIEKCAAELTRHFPGSGERKNQLCDDIICS